MNDKIVGRVLIVDDEEALRFFVGDYLRRANWSVDEAGSGDEALKIMEQRPFDIVLLDLRMPGMDGVTAMNHIEKRWPETMVIIMTAYATIESAVSAVRHGAFDYLQKPCNANDVMTCVNRALAAKKEREKERDTAVVSTASLSTNNLHIDVNARVVTLNDELIPLTPTEYELLLLLAETPGTAVSINRLIEDGLKYAPYDRQAQETLRVHISRMRGKLGSGYIHTVRGGGYVLANTG